MATRQLTRWHVIRSGATALLPARATIFLSGREWHRQGLVNRMYHVSERRTLAIAPEMANWSDEQFVAQVIRLSSESWDARHFRPVQRALRSLPRQAQVLPDDEDVQDVQGTPAMGAQASAPTAAPTVAAVAQRTPGRPGALVAPVAPAGASQLLHTYIWWEIGLIDLGLVLGFALSSVNSLSSVAPVLFLVALVWAAVRDWHGLWSLRGLINWPSMSGAGRT